MQYNLCLDEFCESEKEVPNFFWQYSEKLLKTQCGFNHTIVFHLKAA